MDADITQSFSRTCHDHADIHKNTSRWGDQHHIYDHSDSLNGAGKLGDFPHGGWLPDADT